ncbi:MAG: TA system VapC family ribonuclease toxin [Dehalococcoidia bacterium]
MSEYLADANVWVALAVERHVHHEVARRWLGSVEPAEGVLFCRATQQALLRLLTTSAVMAPHGRDPLTNDEAWAVLAAFLRDDRISVRLDEGQGLDAAWRRFAGRPSASPKLWMDAYLAAFAIAGGYRLVTADRAFRQFQGLDVVILGESPAPR